MELNEKILNDENLEEVQGGTQIPVIIKSGDTLGALAKKYNCTVDDLCRWNNIRNADQIEVGQKVVIKTECLRNRRTCNIGIHYSDFISRSCELNCEY